jgi:ABC-type protease/lipase transport system fused ATPase/permease subunit
LIFSWREFCHNGIARQQQPLRDLDQVRAFLSGAGPTAFLDMPWIPLSLIPLFLFIRQSVS